MKNNNHQQKSVRYAHPTLFGIIVTILNVIILGFSVVFYWRAFHIHDLKNYSDSPLNSAIVTTTNDLFSRNLRELSEDMCNDPVWCNIPMPTVSYFKFSPPNDPVRWRLAQIQASKGDQVILKEAIKAFPNHFDFIDGDITFRKLHFAMDMFVDEARDLSPLAGKKKSWFKKATKTVEDLPPDEETMLRKMDELKVKLHAEVNQRMLTEADTDADAVEDTDNIMYNTTALLEFIKDEEEYVKDYHDGYERRRLIDTMPITTPKLVGGKMRYPWELQGKKVIPDPYDFRDAKRAPVVSVGYTAYVRDSHTYFTGNRIGGAFIDRSVFFKYWRKVMHNIDTPFIAVCSLNENWGMLSTMFPNRTAGWGRCCDSRRDMIVYDFLNHEKTLMLVTNQHTNVSHPKLLILPRGIPITWGFTRMIVWDTMRNVQNTVPKSKLLFAASSKWGPRPQILSCISKKFNVEDFDGHAKKPPAQRLDRKEYYIKMTRAMFGLGLPGLGYDTFRMWELMTLGVIVVVEKGVGFDRTVSATKL